MSDDAAAILGHGFTIERGEDFDRVVLGVASGMATW
jgi:hypothetical protein